MGDVVSALPATVEDRIVERDPTQSADAEQVFARQACAGVGSAGTATQARRLSPSRRCKHKRIHVLVHLAASTYKTECGNIYPIAGNDCNPETEFSIPGSHYWDWTYISVIILVSLIARHIHLCRVVGNIV